MKREEAIKVLEIVEHMESFSTLYEPGEYINQVTVSELKEACRMAISALRTQQTSAKLDRSRWEGCDRCGDAISSGKMIRYGRRYCPFCGRPLTEGAWAELERRIGGNDGTVD